MTGVKRLRSSVVLLGLILAACGGSPASGIQGDLDNDPRLKRAGIEAKVSEYRDGFVTIKITKHSFGPRARAAIASGASMRDIYMQATMDVKPLMESEEVLRKRPEVKAIIWKIE